MTYYIVNGPCYYTITGQWSENQRYATIFDLRIAQRVVKHLGNPGFKILPVVYQDKVTGVTFKAHEGNRRKNLLSIANLLESALADQPYNKNIEIGKEIAHKLRGYCEQLRIIADELK